MLFLNNQDIQSVLDMGVCLEALEVGYRDLAENRAGYAPRLDLYAPAANPQGYYCWGGMAGAADSPGIFAIRMKSDILYWPEGGTEEKYSVRPGTFCGLIMLFSTRNGEPLAIMNDGYLQHMRVGGSAGIGAKYLARSDASRVGMIGSGGMARAYLRAFCKVRPIRSVRVYSPTAEHRRAYAQDMSQALGIAVEPVDRPEEAARDCDILATCTDSQVPVMKASWLKPGMHFTCVKTHEVDPQVYKRCDVIIELGEALLEPVVVGTPEQLARLPSHAHGLPFRGQKDVFPYPHLVDLLKGRAQGRINPQQITCFLTHGTQGLQFAAVGGKVLELARARGLGREIPTEWFLQDIRD